MAIMWKSSHIPRLSTVIFSEFFNTFFYFSETLCSYFWNDPRIGGVKRIQIRNRNLQTKIQNNIFSLCRMLLLVHSF